MKPITLALILILFFVMPIIGFADETEIPKIGFVKNDGSNVRAGDNINFESLCSLDRLDPVKIIDKRYSWFKIALPKKAHIYISSDFVDVISEEMRTGQVNASRVNFRAGPGTKYSILGQASKSQEIDMISEKDGWYKIMPPDGTAGWIHENQLVFNMSDAPESVKKAKIEESVIAKKVLKKKAFERLILKQTEPSGNLTFSK